VLVWRKWQFAALVKHAYMAFLNDIFANSCNNRTELSWTWPYWVYLDMDFIILQVIIIRSSWLWFLGSAARLQTRKVLADIHNCSSVNYFTRAPEKKWPERGMSTTFQIWKIDPDIVDARHFASHGARETTLSTLQLPVVSWMMNSHHLCKPHFRHAASTTSFQNADEIPS